MRRAQGCESEGNIDWRIRVKDSGYVLNFPEFKNVFYILECVRRPMEWL